MPDSRGVQGGRLGPAEEVLSGEALYRQAMAHYRRREWQQAQEDLIRLKAVEPGRRGIDTVLDELAIFIRLESLGRPPTLARGSRPALLPLPGRWPLPASLAMLALVAVLGLLAYSLIATQAAGRVRDLSRAAPALAEAGDWSRAIDAYEEWLLLAPRDAEVRDGLWAAYYARGDQRATLARALEQKEEYARAAELWEGALADFKAAQQVAPDHAPDPRGAPADRAGAAKKAKRCATLLSQALALRSQRRWPDAIYALEAVQAEDASYHSERVAGYLAEAFLEGGQEALAAAQTPAEIEGAVQWFARAAQVQPGAQWAQIALSQAERYLQGAISAEKQDWEAAMLALAPLASEPVDLTGGRALTLLCQAQVGRAGERYKAGRLLDAMADYQAVVERCDDAWAKQQVQQIALSLTPAPALRPAPALVPASSAAP